MLSPDADMAVVGFHSVFVTLSPTLCQHVSTYISGLHRTYAHDDKFDYDYSPVVPASLADVPENSFPLVMTYAQFLVALDATLDRPFFVDKGDQTTDVDWDLWALVDTAGGSASSLRNCGFPEARRILDFTFFLLKLWDKMWGRAVADRSIAKADVRILQPNLVFTEIMTHIKGSLESLETQTGFLSRDEYLSLGRKQSTMEAGTREKVYSLFEVYRDLCKRENVYDKADIVYHIYQQVKPDTTRTGDAKGNAQSQSQSQSQAPTSRYKGAPIHALCADEVQDLSQAELRLFFALNIPSNGFFFAGDTAQTIEKGIGFRFVDLRRQFWGAWFDPVPEVKTLTANYRSHRRILELATTVVEVIEDLFPLLIDDLPKDYGVADGPVPVVIEGNSLDDVLFHLVGNDALKADVDFGAQQAIIVRDEESRKNLPAVLQRSLVLTVQQAKGLEFEDVFIYNFFQDSPPKVNWSALLGYWRARPDKEDREDTKVAGTTRTLEDLDLTKKGRPDIHIKEFDAERDRSLCGELKSLYMVITRAKRNVWLFDTPDGKQKGSNVDIDARPRRRRVLDAA
jgi:superfamily I DNA/RNA helicase